MHADRVLIFRPGSLGDTVVALPCFHLLARAFPNAERRVLTNSPRRAAQVAVESVIGGTGLVHGYFEVDYDRIRNLPNELWALRKRIKQWSPDLLVYLTEPRKRGRLFCERTFFKLCGLTRIIGLPVTRELRDYRWDSKRNTYEYEAHRLARCLADFGDACVDDPTNWDLRLTAEERSAARAALNPLFAANNFIACSVGTAIDTKDWGAANWLTLIKSLNCQRRGSALVLVGGSDDFQRSEAIRLAWSGPSLNLCGMLSPRVSAAVMELASVYIGHDSGPMHLAAAVGVPCVAVFSARRKAGIWFPFGPDHRIVYHEVPCSDCILLRCERYAKKCITSITVGEVLQAIETVMHNNLDQSASSNFIRVLN